MRVSCKIRAVIAFNLVLSIPTQQVFGLPVISDSASAATHAHPLITATHAEAIYRRLIEQHWNPTTGLFRSFPDSTDLKMSQQASTYEQAAMGLLAIRFGDLDRARQLLQFFQAAWARGPERRGNRRGWRGLVNFYNADFGSEGIEATIHLGPNAWAGLFAAKLANQTHDADALRFALDVQYWAANGIPHENGGVAMSAHDDPYGAAWTRIYSTENNLSYYAFLTELLRNPRIDKATRISVTRERDQVENWLLEVAYDRFHGRMLRGVNPDGPDRMAVLDTMTWLISAIGPQRLAARGMSPERLLHEMEKTFEVSVGRQKGVDAADQDEANRTYADLRLRADIINRPDKDHHRVVWFEGLGQYSLAWSQLADYEKAAGQPVKLAVSMKKAAALTALFDQAALTNAPNQAAYPYATPGRFFRYGWGERKDSQKGPASSLIAGVWRRVYAGLGLDPLAGRDLATVQRVRVQPPDHIQLAERGPHVLYGTSEDMTTGAWKAIAVRDWDHAIAQAQATIEVWAPQGLYLQEKKREEIGHLVDYSGAPTDSRTIFKYWALNDVAAAYYILGRALDEKKSYDKASRAFQQIVSHYSLAQIWDPQGWFWSPVEAIKTDYVLRDRAHYGWVAQVYSSSRNRAL